LTFQSQEGKGRRFPKLKRRLFRNVAERCGLEPEIDTGYIALSGGTRPAGKRALVDGRHRMSRPLCNTLTHADI